MLDRKLELERKKAKLQAMRADKKRKEEERIKNSKENADNKRDTLVSSASSKKLNTDELLENLGIPLVNEKKEKPVESEPETTIKKTEAVKLQPQKTTANLSMSRVVIHEFVSKVASKYSKETQTPYQKMDAQQADYYALTYVEEDDDHDSGDLLTPPAKMTASVSAERIAAAAADISTSSMSSSGQLKLTDETMPPEMKELSEDEKHNIINSDEFRQFFSVTSRIIERSLGDEDFTMMYTNYEVEDNVKTLINHNRIFFDEHWSKNRNVTSMDWSPKFPELMVASYDLNHESPLEPDGVVLVWNMKYANSAPEFIFHCGSAVTCVRFAKFNSNLIIGATYSGQIMFWDTRAAMESGLRTPLQRTPMSSNAHSHPVFSIAFVGNKDAHSLLSIATDGRLCSWNIDSLSEPFESENLQTSQMKMHTSTCVSFVHGNMNTFVVGGEDGYVYQHTRHGIDKTKSSNTAVSVNGSDEAPETTCRHYGPVTSIDCHGIFGPVDFSGYYLTSSMDWTIKLWNIKESQVIMVFRQNDTCDYVFDVKWSPVHPALFASVNISGQLDIWNLNEDTEVPIATMKNDTGLAFNKCCWHTNGLRISLGDKMGHVYIYDIAESLALPKADEWTQLLATFKEMKNDRNEQGDILS